MAQSRTKKAVHNVLAAFLELAVALVAGLIVPRMIIVHYGSACNGLIASIAKFVSLISVLNVGISGAARAQLYGPLAEKNTEAVAGVVCTMERTFRRVGFALLAFVIVLAVVYPLWVCDDFDYWYTTCLIAIISLTSFSRYFVVAPYEILLYADQKHSIVSYNRAAVELLSAAAVILLILWGSGIHGVKLAGSVIVALGSVSICLIARRRYGLTSSVMQSARPVAPRGIPNRRHAIAQGISDYVNSNVDVILITLLMSVTDVAVYAVYAGVTALCTRLIVNVISSFGAAFGNMYAKGEMDAMRENIKIYELIVFSLCSTVFATALAMIVPFVDVYTAGITDADYHQPLFAFLLTLSALFMCFRIPYETVLKAAGHFRQTKPGAYVELSLNLVLSVAGVLMWGLPGVALGTLVSAIVRTFELAWYFGRHLVSRSYSAFIGHVATTLAICGIAFAASVYVLPGVCSWGSWILSAGSIFGMTLVLTVLVDWCLYRGESRNLLQKLKSTSIGETRSTAA